MLIATTLVKFVLSIHMALEPTQIAVMIAHLGPTHKDSWAKRPQLPAVSTRVEILE